MFNSLYYSYGRDIYFFSGIQKTVHCQKLSKNATNSCGCSKGILINI